MTATRTPDKNPDRSRPMALDLIATCISRSPPAPGVPRHFEQTGRQPVSADKRNQAQNAQAAIIPFSPKRLSPGKKNVTAIQRAGYFAGKFGDP